MEYQSSSEPKGAGAFVGEEKENGDELTTKREKIKRENQMMLMITKRLKNKEQLPKPSDPSELGLRRETLTSLGSQRDIKGLMRNVEHANRMKIMEVLPSHSAWRMKSRMVKAVDWN
ncbi:hypothetical protein L1887_03037 [Cichorium endivia]|nr:hypothetical protein L1887_03037 [Cichorium endivia]